MPTFDFFGYAPQQVDRLIETIRPHLTTLPFASDIVFIRRNEASRVIDLSGGEQPFVRIYTRKKERADILIERLKRFFDVEIIYIGEFQRHEPGA